MSRFDLRDVSDRLTRSRDIKAVVFEFLRSLEGARNGWRATLAFYEVSQDAFVDVFETDGNRLIRREIIVRAGDLPERLVRKLFDASAICNARERPSLFSGGLGTAPCYVAEPQDASPLMALTVLPEWRSCICMPLGDQSDLIGILTITSNKKNAFGGRAVGDILPVKSLVTVALAKHLQHAGHVPAKAPAREARPAKAQAREAGPAKRLAIEAALAKTPAPEVAPVETPAIEETLAKTAAPEVAPVETPAIKAAPAKIPAPEAAPPKFHAPEAAPPWAPAPEVVRAMEPAPEVAPAVEPAREAAFVDPLSEVAAELRAQLEALSGHSHRLDDEERSRDEALEDLTREFESRQRSTDEYREELDRVKALMGELEAQSVEAVEHLAEAYSEINEASWKMADLERRVTFARRFLAVLGQEPDDRRLPTVVIGWLSNDLGVDRCSLMTIDEREEVLQISAQCGIDAGVAARVRVRVGQGVAGWVAHNRKPLLVRMRSQAEITPEEQAETYNSESFIAVPVVHGGHLYGVLNLSNKQGGELFDGVDFDCASLAGAALAVRLAAGGRPARLVTARAA